jgi:hypothetical protein
LWLDSFFCIRFCICLASIHPSIHHGANCINDILLFSILLTFCHLWPHWLAQGCFSQS